MTPPTILRLLPLALVIAASPALAGPESGRVTASSLNVRQGPGAKHKVRAALPRGHAVTIKEARGGWLSIEAELDGKTIRGWVSERYIERGAGSVEEPAKDLKPATYPKSRKAKLKFIRDHSRSTLDLLGERGIAWRRRDWHAHDYPGAPRGPAENEARALAGALKKVCPERRVNTGPARLPFDYEAIEPRLVSVPGQERYKLHRAAAKAFVRMRAAAAKDGVQLRIVSAARSLAHQKRLAGKNKNPAAVAQGVSAHNYGLAVDFAMSPGAEKPLKEVSTRPFDNVMAMRRSPVHKWLFFFGRDYGWFPYTNEPWHWEFNPEGLRESFP